MQDNSILFYPADREAVSLDGDWKFCPDPMGRCRRQKWWLNERPANQASPCWDIEGLLDIKVPAAWNVQFEKLFFYEGEGVYIRDFRIPEEWLEDGDGDFLLCFDGVRYACEVYVNGIGAGRHECGYSPFSFNVTDIVSEHNRIFVLVENIRHDWRLPGLIFDWFNYGGITGTVRLVKAPAKRVQNFKIDVSLSENTVNISAAVFPFNAASGEKLPVRVRFPMLGLEEESSAGPGEPVRFHFETGEKDILWNPLKPVLQKVEIRYGEDCISDEIGLREVKTAGSNILINNRPVKLKGVNIHAQFRGSGPSHEEKDIDDLIEILKDLGANFVRCAHYPYPGAVIKRLTKEGFLVWEEIPAYWQPKMSESRTKRLALQMMGEMIQRDWNRAGTIFWSLGNECAYRNEENSVETYSYYGESACFVRKLDSTRLLTSADAMLLKRESVHPGYAGKETVYSPHMEESLIEALDVLSGNFYREGDLLKEYRTAAGIYKKYNKPYIFSEFGGISLRGFHGDAREFATEENHADCISAILEEFSSIKELAGWSVWMLFDYYTPLHWQWFAGKKSVKRRGLLDENWEKKKVYDVIKKFIRGEKQPGDS